MKTVTLLLSDSEASLLRSTLNTAAQMRHAELVKAEKAYANDSARKPYAQAVHDAEELLRIVGNSIDAAKS